MEVGSKNVENSNGSDDSKLFLSAYCMHEALF